ncbi:hypothetical protein IHQ71_30125 (plasmid) [Rhizobium sp. TH2]|nr:hypothetical protein [Rhizobium sp. TH2]UVC12501.1 hypothetical protein IHQ71_30125 [Rhizobium sp. TH2]
MLETAQELELAGIRDLVEGSDLTIDQLYEKATKNCYLKADAPWRMV